MKRIIAGYGRRGEQQPMTILLYVYVFLFIHRPFEVWPELGELRLEFYFSIVLALVWLAYPRKRLTLDWLSGSVCLFAVSLLVCWSLSPWPEFGTVVLYKWLAHLLFFVVVATIPWSAEQLRKLLICFMVVFFCYMGHSLVEFANGRLMYRMGIARLMGIDETYGDPNTFAASIVFALVFVGPLWVSAPSALLRSFLIGFVALSMTCVVLSGSRAAAVSLVVLYLLATISARFRARWLLLGGAAFVAVLLALPDQLHNRFLSALDPEYGPASARASAEGRWHGLERGLEVWNENLLSGGGPGSWKPVTGLSLESHNLYGQLGAELGLLGVVSFGMLIGSWMATVWTLARRGRHENWPAFFVCLNTSLGILLALLLVHGMFAHNLYRYTWIWAAGILCVLRAIAEQTAPEPSSAEELDGFETVPA
jgi:hypothetical protein